MVASTTRQLRRSTGITFVASGFPSRIADHLESTSQSICARGKDWRSAATAGSVCTMSPSAPMRSMRKRPSAMGCLANARDEIARGMLLRVSGNCETNAETRGFLALGNCVDSVVGALRVNVWMKVAQKSTDVGLVENYDVIHGGERGNKFGARLRGQNRAAGAFDSADARIGIYRDNENVAFPARAFEIADVPRMQNVETAVREHDLLSAGAMLIEERLQIGARENFGTGVHAPAVASPRIADSSSARVTVAVPRFITTMPPA